MQSNALLLQMVAGHAWGVLGALDGSCRGISLARQQRAQLVLPKWDSSSQRAAIASAMHPDPRMSSSERRRGTAAANAGRPSGACAQHSLRRGRRAGGCVSAQRQMQAALAASCQPPSTRLTPTARPA